MEKDRRKFFGMMGLGAAAISAPAMTAAVAVLAQQKLEPLPKVSAGNTVRASDWNDMIERVNELTRR